MVFINKIVAPVDRPQVAAPKPAPAPAPPRLDRLDERLLEHLRDAGSCPTWTLLDIVADEQAPRDRTAGRLLRLDLLGRLKRLRRLGLAFLVGRNWVSDTRPDPAMRRPAGRRRRTGSGLRHNRGVSADKRLPHPPKQESPHQVGAQLLHQTPASYSADMGGGNIKIAPDRALIAQAARNLARLPRRPVRRWSGMIGPIRSYRGMVVRLPDGREVYALGARRGQVPYTAQPDGPVGAVDGLGRD
jgi:hypothetical protein